LGSYFEEPLPVAVVALDVVLAGALALGYESRVSEKLADPHEWFALLILIVPGGLCLAGIALWLRPGPQPPAAQDP